RTFRAAARSRVRAHLLRHGGDAPGPRRRHRVRPASAPVRRARRRAGAGRLRPGAGRTGGLAPARLRTGPQLPRHARLASGVGARKARSYNRRMMDISDPSLRNTLQAGLRALALDPALAPPLLDYLALLVRWNRTYNHTAVRDPQQMVTRHLLDSLALAPHLDGVSSLAD